jgi:hypothetical protein
MQELETSTIEKINVWLNGNYDEATKQEIQQLLDSNLIQNSRILFTETWSLVPVVYAVLWELALTGLTNTPLGRQPRD